jgi:hypothetical protein
MKTYEKKILYRGHLGTTIEMLSGMGYELSEKIKAQIIKDHLNEIKKVTFEVVVKIEDEESGK